MPGRQPTRTESGDQAVTAQPMVLSAAAREYWWAPYRRPESRPV